MDLATLLGMPGLGDHLVKVESALRTSVQTNGSFLGQVASHLLSAGGKRIRPGLTIAVAKTAGAPVSDEVVLGGVAAELVHIGSLYHDDVMDEAGSRRGVESVNHRWGNLVAILAGDYLLARASEIAATLGTGVAGLLARTIGQLCEGQVAELQTAYDVNRTEEAYFESINGKTASLTASACRIGAAVSGLPDAHTEAFAAFGEAFGMAFQIRDDVLDVIGDEATLGKPVGKDLVEGTYSLPIIRALQDPALGDELRALLGRPLDDPERDKARDIVRATSGVEQALAVARRYATDAEQTLASAFGGTAPPLASAAHRLLDAI